jgi:hypothetical protein
MVVMGMSDLVASSKNGRVSVKWFSRGPGLGQPELGASVHVRLLYEPTTAHRFSLLQ